MVTVVGLNLEYDCQHGSTENFFRQLFGRWPQHACDVYMKELLTKLVQATKYGDTVCKFFGLGAERALSVSEHDLAEVEAGLAEIRQDLRTEVLMLYQELPEKNNLDQTWVELIVDLKWENEKLKRELRELEGADLAALKASLQNAHQGDKGYQEYLQREEHKRKILDERIDGYFISQIERALKRASIHTVEDITQKTMEELWKIRGVGQAGFIAVLKFLTKHGLSLSA